ncbi:MAG: hypothetical protein WBD31_23870 [Rubripirellula sp.]
MNQIIAKDQTDADAVDSSTLSPTRGGAIPIVCSLLLAIYVIYAWFPYAERIFNANTDWSQIQNAGSEPWDGTLLGMYILTFAGWFILGIIAFVAGSQVQRRAGIRLQTFFISCAIAAPPILVALWFATKRMAN